MTRLFNSSASPMGSLPDKQARQHCRRVGQVCEPLHLVARSASGHRGRRDSAVGRNKSGAGPDPILGCACVWSSSRDESRVARTVVLKLRTSEFNILSRCHTPSSPPSSCEGVINMRCRCEVCADWGYSFIIIKSVAQSDRAKSCYKISAGSELGQKTS
jgi:hypothetical protein